VLQQIIMTAIDQYRVKHGATKCAVLLEAGLYAQLCMEMFKGKEDDLNSLGIGVVEFYGADIYKVETNQDASIVIAGEPNIVPI